MALGIPSMRAISAASSSNPSTSLLVSRRSSYADLKRRLHPRVNTQAKITTTNIVIKLGEDDWLTIQVTQVAMMIRTASTGYQNQFLRANRKTSNAVGTMTNKTPMVRSVEATDRPNSPALLSGRAKATTESPMSVSKRPCPPAAITTNCLPFACSGRTSASPDRRQEAFPSTTPCRSPGRRPSDSYPSPRR